MTDVHAEFLGGELSGQFRSPISEVELQQLGYRVGLNSAPRGNELAVCIAVPITWTHDEAHLAIIEKFSPGAYRKPGKKSL